MAPSVWESGRCFAWTGFTTSGEVKPECVASRRLFLAPRPGQAGADQLSHSSQPDTRNRDLTPISRDVISSAFLGETTTTTAADGTFTITLNPGISANAITVASSQLAGSTQYPNITALFTSLFDHAIYVGNNNVLSRPIILTPIDSSHATTVDPTQDTTVTTPLIPNASLTIPAGSLTTSSGQLYSGPLSLSAISPSNSPTPLPSGYNPIMTYMIEPQGLSINQTPDLELPNLAGYTAGTQMAFYDYDPGTGQTTEFALGGVSADGETLSINGDAPSFFSGFFFALPKDYEDPNPPEAPDDDDPCDDGDPGGGPIMIPTVFPIPDDSPPPETYLIPYYESIPQDEPEPAPSIPLFTGKLQDTKKVTNSNLQGSVVSLGLTYNSGRASPSSVVQLGYTYDNFDYQNGLFSQPSG